VTVPGRGIPGRLSLLFVMAMGATALAAPPDDAALADRIGDLAARLQAAADLDERAALAGELDRALGELELRAHRGDARREAEYRGVMALARHLEGDPRSSDERVAWLERAHRAASGLPRRGSLRAEPAIPLANEYIVRGELDRAEAILRDAIDHLGDADPRGIVAGFQVAQLLNHRGDWDGAIAALDRAERVLDVIEPEREEAAWHAGDRARLFGFRGDVFLRMGLVDQGFVGAEREWEAVRALPDPVRRIVEPGAIVHRANALLAAERFRSVVELVDDALARRAAGKAHEVAALLVRKGLALAALSRSGLPDEDPREVLERALELEGAPVTERRAAALTLADLRLRRGDADGTIRILEESGASGSALEEAYRRALLALAERARGDSGLEARLRELDRALDALVADWWNVHLREGGVGFLRHRMARAAIGARIELMLDGGAPVSEALATLLEAQSVSTLARRLAADAGERPPRGDVADLRSRLEADEGLLFYLPGEDGGHLFALDAAEVRHAPLAPRHEIEALREPFVSEVTRSPFGLPADDRARRIERLRRAGSDLRDLLLPGGVRAWVSGWSRLTIVAPELLGYLPFECLPAGSDSWLGLEQSIGYVASAAVAAALARRRASRPSPGPDVRDALIVAAPRLSGELPATLRELPHLPFGERERDRLAGSYAPGEVEILSGAEASFENLRRRLDARLVQFVAHGFHDYTRERTAGLLLAPDSVGPNGASPDGASPDAASSVAGGDGRVFADRWAGVRVPGLVILTACGTGRGPVRFGDSGASHLGGTFLLAGADTVLLPFAEIAYEPTLALCEVVHEGLVRGRTPADALTGARRAVAARAATADPFYFGLLHAHGLPHARVAGLAASALTTAHAQEQAARPEAQPPGGEEGSESGGEDAGGGGSPILAAVLAIAGLGLIAVALLRIRDRRSAR